MADRGSGKNGISSQSNRNKGITLNDKLLRAFYTKFIKHAGPSIQVIKKRGYFKWTKECENAFKKASSFYQTTP